MNLCEMLVDRARSHGDAMAILERRRTVTFAELEELTARGAGLLRQSGLVAGDRVLILQPVSIELYVILLAALRLGLVPTLIDPSTNGAQFEAALGRARPRAFAGSTRAQFFRLRHRALRKLKPAFTTGIPWPGLRAWRPRQSPLFAPIAPRAAGDAALITFTSGSTGAPRATVRSHGLLLAQHAALETALDLRRGEVDLATLPVFVLANLASGVCSILPDADMRRPGAVDPEPVLSQIQAHGAVRSTASPAFFERLLGGSNPERLAPMRKLYTGGAPVFPTLLERLEERLPDGRIVTVYGSTEAEPIAHVAWSDVSADDRRRMRQGRGLLVGAPVDCIQIRILRLPVLASEAVPTFSSGEFENFRQPAGMAGEIVVTGAHVVPGYLDGIGDAETKIEVDGVRWHRTGDAGMLDERGRLWLLGRADAVITDEHGSLYPFPVECAAATAPGVRRSALYAASGRRVLAVELAKDSNEAEVLASLRHTLDWAHLSRIHPVPTIPVDRRHNAKVDYVALARLAGEA